jgi:hypothetical protein
MEHSFVVTIKEGEWVTIYKLGEILEDGTIEIDYRYQGSLSLIEVNQLIENWFNELLEDILYKETSDVK